MALLQPAASAAPWMVGLLLSTTNLALKKCKKKKYLHDPDNHDGVISHLEPDILESEVKLALESITMNKASGGDSS